MRVVAVNGMNVASPSESSTLADAVLLLREHDDRAALGRLVRKRGELRGLGKLALVDAVDRQELRRLAVAERDRAGLVEEQDVDVAGRLDRATRHGEDVALDEPVHAGDADRREQAADRRRDERDEQRDRARSSRSRCPRRRRTASGSRRRTRKAMVRPDEQDVERDLVRRLAPLGALDERDHAVEERLARLLRDLDDEPVREEPRAAGDGRAVAAGLADDGRGLAGDRRLVDRAGALDDVAVGGDDLARPRRPRRRRGGDPVPGRPRSNRAGVLPVGERRRSRRAERFRPAPCRGPPRSPRRSWRRAR